MTRTIDINLNDITIHWKFRTQFLYSSRFSTEFSSSGDWWWDSIIIPMDDFHLNEMNRSYPRIRHICYTCSWQSIRLEQPLKNDQIISTNFTFEMGELGTWRDPTLSTCNQFKCGIYNKWYIREQPIQIDSNFKWFTITDASIKFWVKIALKHLHSQNGSFEGIFSQNYKHMWSEVENVNALFEISKA